MGRNGKEEIEDIILRYSGRGMERLQKNLPRGYCGRAAKALLKLQPGTVILTTGFYVDGFAETDGPPGTVCLAYALSRLGFSVVILTDLYCQNFFDPPQNDIDDLAFLEGNDGIHANVQYAPFYADKRYYKKIFQEWEPVAVISVERCGENVEGNYANMRGINITEHTAKIDFLFSIAAERGVLTIGIGDGGNEIGMGNQKEWIAAKLSCIPCQVRTDHLIAATVSNWGAYGLAAYLQKMTKLPLLLKQRQLAAYLEWIVSVGSIDGITKKHVASVDGFPVETEKEILRDLGAD